MGEAVDAKPGAVEYEKLLRAVETINAACLQLSRLGRTASGRAFVSDYIAARKRLTDKELVRTMGGAMPGYRDALLIVVGAADRRASSAVESWE